jgi:hypothetical protein
MVQTAVHVHELVADPTKFGVGSGWPTEVVVQGNQLLVQSLATDRCMHARSGRVGTWAQEARGTWDATGPQGIEAGSQATPLFLPIVVIAAFLPFIRK